MGYVPSVFMVMGTTKLQVILGQIVLTSDALLSYLPLVEDLSGFCWNLVGEKKVTNYISSISQLFHIIIKLLFTRPNGLIFAV